MRHVRGVVTPVASIALGALLGGTLVAASMVAQQVATSPSGTPRVTVARPETAVDAPIVLRAPNGLQQASSTGRFATATTGPETFGRRGTDGLIALDATSLDLATGAFSTPRVGLAAALDTNSLGPTLLRSSATRTALRAERAAEANEDDDDDDEGEENDDGEENGKSHGRAKGKAHGNAKGHSSSGKKDKQEKNDGEDDDGDHEGKGNGKEKDDGGDDKEDDD